MGEPFLPEILLAGTREEDEAQFMMKAKTNGSSMKLEHVTVEMPHLFCRAGTGSALPAAAGRFSTVPALQFFGGISFVKCSSVETAYLKRNEGSGAACYGQRLPLRCRRFAPASFHVTRFTRVNVLYTKHVFCLF